MAMYKNPPYGKNKKWRWIKMDERFKFKLDKDKIKLQLKDLGRKLIRKKGKFSKSSSVVVFFLLIVLGYLIYSGQQNVDRDNYNLNFSGLDLVPPDLEFEYDEQDEFLSNRERVNEISLNYERIQTTDFELNESINEIEESREVVTESFWPVNQIQRTDFSILRPISGEVLQGSGWYFNSILDDWRYQQGIELAGNMGDIVMAAANGNISTVKEDEYKGIMVIIEHENGWLTEYGHLERVSVSPGVRVMKGQEIGRIGITGIISQPSLYFSLKNKDGAVSPVDFFE